MIFLIFIYVINFPHMDSNIPTKPAYGVYISPLVRIGTCRICEKFNSFTSRHRLPTERLIKQGYKHRMLCLSFKKICRRQSLIFKVEYP